MVGLSAGIVLIPGAPLGLITTSVQALAGLLLPSASVFLLLLCNDREVLGPWVNARWLNLVATVIISVLLILSGTLMASTLFPSVNVTTCSSAWQSPWRWRAPSRRSRCASYLGEGRPRLLRRRWAGSTRCRGGCRPSRLLKPVNGHRVCGRASSLCARIPDRQRVAVAGEGDSARRGMTVTTDPGSLSFRPLGGANASPRPGRREPIQAAAP